MNKFLTISFLLLVSLQAMATELVKTVSLADGRDILASENGLTLYTFDVDEPGASNCHGGCLRAWPPLLADENTIVEAPYSLVERTDGTLQLALNEKPLYFFIGDRQEGDVKGDNLQGVWHIILKTSEARDISEHNLSSEGIGMLNGSGQSAVAFDPVSFFPEAGGKGLEGKSEFTVSHEGVEYLFATAENMKVFIAEPNKYEPTYGGWCARAMVEGQKVHINTDYFTVVGNRSFFFVSSRAKKFFDRNLLDNIAKADAQWKEISGEEARI